MLSKHPVVLLSVRLHLAPGTKKSVLLPQKTGPLTLPEDAIA
jgi:hypothetical protein